MTMHKAPQEQWKAQGEAARLARAEMLATTEEINKRLKARFGDKIRIETLDDTTNYGLENLTQAEMDEFLEISGIGRGRVTKTTMEPMPGARTGHLPPPNPPATPGEARIYRLLCFLREACRVRVDTLQTVKGLGATPEDFEALEMLVLAAGKKGVRIP